MKPKDVNNPVSEDKPWKFIDVANGQIVEAVPVPKSQAEPVEPVNPMPGHSPGPWSAVYPQSGAAAVMKEHELLAVLGPGLNADVIKANATLIAQSPDLLDVLEWLIANCVKSEEVEMIDRRTSVGEVVNREVLQCRDQDVIDEIRWLIKKARGVK